MIFQVESFRHAATILGHQTEWHEVKHTVEQLEPAEIVRIHRGYSVGGKKGPAGGQTAMNDYFLSRLKKAGWFPQPRLFGDKDPNLRKWKMDFIKNRVGVEVSFNHAEAIPWTFSRLNIAGESERVKPESRIDIGVAIFAMRSLRDWAKMDNAVGTYDVAIAWLREMKPILPIPILVIGLDASPWKPTDAFRGTSRGTRRG